METEYGRVWRNVVYSEFNVVFGTPPPLPAFPNPPLKILCFVRKICRFARKVCRLASKRQKMAHGTVAGSAPQPWTQGPQHAMPAPSCGLLSLKKALCHKRLAGIVKKTGREDQRREIFQPKHIRRAPPFSRQSFVATYVTHGKLFWQRSCATHHETQGQKLL